MRTVWGTRTLCPRWRCLKSAVAPLTATATRTSPGGCPPSCQSAQAMITGLDHVQVAAPPGCEAEARGFYGRLLGLPEVEKPDALKPNGGVWFQCGAQQLHVGVAQDFTPATKAHPAFVPTELDALAERLTSAGAPVRWEDGRFFTDDPWGNRLELMTAGARPTP